MRALVIGNGESRKDINLDIAIKDYEIVVGCNAIHRDFIPDHLVCCDNRMVKEALQNPSVKKIYTREKYYQEHRKIAKHKNVLRLPSLPYQGYQRVDDPVHWGSGPYAVLLAADLGAESVDLIGFDLYSNNDKVNNVYKGTENYSRSNYQAVDPAYWILQIKQVFKNFPDKKFRVFNNLNWKPPRDWLCDNVSFENILRYKALTLNIESV
jgi:uncharacterized Rossmann fold enzyme